MIKRSIKRLAVAVFRSSLFTRLTTAGLRSSLESVGQEIQYLRMHRKGLRKSRKLLGEEHMKLHIACGPKAKAGWVNIDFSPEADFALDMREPFPFYDNSCSIIYSEHFFEHVDYPEHAIGFLQECYRVLEPGGVFSVGVPDTEPAVEDYFRRKAHYHLVAGDHSYSEWCQTAMEHLNNHFRQHEHLFCYDFMTLEKVLTYVGFQDISRREFDAEMDSSDRELGTLYVNASRPITG